MGTKTFHVGDILSITTGALVSPTHMKGIYQILNWLTGDDLMTHQLPRAADECEDFLKRKFPQLPDRAPSFGGSKERVDAWLSEVVATHGEWFEVPRMHADDHTHINPLAEIKMIRPDVPVISIELPEDDQ